MTKLEQISLGPPVASSTPMKCRGGGCSVPASPLCAGRLGVGRSGGGSVPASPLRASWSSLHGEGEGEGALRPTVVARVRPVWGVEVAAGMVPEVHVVGNQVEIQDARAGSGISGQRRTVRCTAALDGDASNEDVYRQFGDLSEALMERVNVTLFAYGETGSGKTHTMSYIADRFIADLLTHRQFYDTFALEVSMVEIENERIYDLARRGADRGPALSILNYRVQGAQWLRVTGAAQLGECWRRRRTTTTEANETSSRSHAVCTVRLHAAKAGVHFTSEAHFIDLAGSERSGLASLEGSPNASLTLLSMIVKDLVSGHERANYRQSKLTHLLQPALSGRCRLGLLFTLNPCSARGALSSAQFAQYMMHMPPARPVRNPAVMSEAQLVAASEALLAKEAAVAARLESAEGQRAAVEEENERLRAQLEAGRAANGELLAASVAAQREMAEQLEASRARVAADHGAVRKMMASFESHAGGVEMRLRGLAEGLGCAGEEATEVGATLEAISHLRTSFRALDAAYGAGRVGEVAADLPRVAANMAALNPSFLLQGLVGRLRRAASEGRMARREVVLVDALEEQLRAAAPSALEGDVQAGWGAELGAHAAEHIAAGRHARRLEVEIKQLQRENEALRLNIAMGPPSLPENNRRVWRNSEPAAPEQFDGELRAEIDRLPAPAAFERLTHVVGLSTRCRHRFLALGGIARMVSAGLLQGNPQAQVRTASAIPTFCCFHEARDAVRLAGGCAALAQMVGAEGAGEAEDGRIAACGALRELCVGNAANKELFAAYAMSGLVGAMDSESQHLQEAAASAYSQLVEGCAVAKAKGRKAGALVALLNLCAVRNGRVRLQAVRALSRSLADDPTNQDRMRVELLPGRPATGLHTIATGLADSVPAIRRAYAQALLACVYDNGANLAALCEPALLDAVQLDTGTLYGALLRSLSATLAADPLLRSSSSNSRQSSSPGVVVSSSSPDGFQHYGVLLAGSWAPESRGVGPADTRLYSAPQFSLHAPSPITLAVHLALDNIGRPSVTLQADLRLLCFAADTSAGVSRANVLFDKLVSLSIVDSDDSSKDCAELCVDLPGGDFTIVALCRPPSDVPLDFRVAFAAEREFEVEATPSLAGWHKESSGVVASGAIRGWWRGGCDSSGAHFWRNPQFLLAAPPSKEQPRVPTRAPVDEAPPTIPRSAVMSWEPTPRHLSVTAAAARSCEAILVEIRTRGPVQPAAPEFGLAAFRHPTGPTRDGSWVCCPGQLTVLEEKGEENAIVPSPPSFSVLSSVPGRLLVALDWPEKAPLTLVPYLAADDTDDGGEVDFDINLFTTVPAHMRSNEDGSSKEWAIITTLSLPFDSDGVAQAVFELTSESSEIAARVFSSASTSDGGPASHGAAVLRLVDCSSDTKARSTVGPLATLAGFAGGMPSGRCRLTVQYIDGADDTTTQPLTLQLFSSDPEIQVREGTVVGAEVVSARLPRPLPQSVHSLSSETRPASPPRLEGDALLRMSQSQDPARHLREVVAQLKQEVAVLRESHGEKDALRSPSGAPPSSTSKPRTHRRHASRGSASSPSCSVTGDGSASIQQNSSSNMSVQQGPEEGGASSFPVNKAEKVKRSVKLWERPMPDVTPRTELKLVRRERDQAMQQLVEVNMEKEALRARLAGDGQRWAQPDDGDGGTAAIKKKPAFNLPRRASAVPSHGSTATPRDLFASLTVQTPRTNQAEPHTAQRSASFQRALTSTTPRSTSASRSRSLATTPGRSVEYGQQTRISNSPAAPAPLPSSDSGAALGVPKSASVATGLPFDDDNVSKVDESDALHPFWVNDESPGLSPVRSRQHSNETGGASLAQPVDDASGDDMIVEAGVVNAADLVEAKEAVSVAEVVVNVSADANAVSLAALAERPSDSDRQDSESVVSAGDDFAVQTRSIPISAAAALSSKKNAYDSSSTRRRPPGAPQCGCAIC